MPALLLQEVRDSADSAGRAFVEQLLRTGLMLIDVVGALLEELPEDAFPGEDRADVLLDMLAGSLQPVFSAAGEMTVTQAAGLIGALGDKTLADLRTAAQLAASSGAGER